MQRQATDSVRARLNRKVKNMKRRLGENAGKASTGSPRGQRLDQGTTT